MPYSSSIKSTKFYIPPPTSDFVNRKSLEPMFEYLKSVPVMLISASTGYGKSTLVTSFLLNQKEKYAWLSLSEKENEFSQFITYFIQAIQVKIRDFGNEILELANAPELPSVDELAEMLAEEIEKIESLFYFALDDYHLIKNNEINQFITKIFEYTLPFFRLIILTRRDPSLPLSQWRNKNKVVEIRSSDLKFTKNEITRFCEKTISYHPDDNILAQMQDISDGWISGLRMLILSLNSGEELGEQFLNFKYKKSFVIQQMVDGILSNLPEARKQTMLELSILKEFNVELFSVLCLDEKDIKNKELLFNEFTMTIVRSNMFIIALDDRHRWFRFHHMFLDQIYEAFLQKVGKDEVASLRSKAAYWYCKNGFQEDSIIQYIEAGLHEKAIDVFQDFRLKLISETRFEKLEYVLNLFPEKVQDKSGILLLTKAWIILHHGNIPKMAKLFGPIHHLLEEEPHSRELMDSLEGEIHSLKAFNSYLSEVDIQACLEHSKKSIELLDEKNSYALGMSWVYYGASLQILGHQLTARKEIYKEIEVCASDIIRGQLLLILCFLDWFEGNLGSLVTAAEHLLRFGHETGIKMFIANGNILLGLAYYYQNNDTKALDYLLESYKLRYFTYMHMSFGSGMALADIYALSGKEKEKENILRAYEETALKQGGKLFIKISKSSASSLAYRYGNDFSGLKWAKENDSSDFLPFANLYSPELVQALILTLDSDPKSHKMAEDALNIAIPFFDNRNDINVIIRALTIQAVLYYKSSNKKKAFDIIQRVLDLSSIGNFIRPYLELGASMKSLLIEFQKNGMDSQHINDIIQNLTMEKAPSEGLQLSNREKEILILTENMTNKEIGNQLFIAEKTVKTHITNINKKLNVNSKLDALIKAKELAFL